MQYRWLVFCKKMYCKASSPDSRFFSLLSYGTGLYRPYIFGPELKVAPKAYSRVCNMRELIQFLCENYDMVTGLQHVSEPFAISLSQTIVPNSLTATPITPNCFQRNCLCVNEKVIWLDVCFQLKNTEAEGSFSSPFES